MSNSIPNPTSSMRNAGDNSPMSKEKEVAYCGLYCGDCIIRKGKLAFLSQQLLVRMLNPDFQKLAWGLPDLFPHIVSDLKDQGTCIKVLKAMTYLDCTKACKEGGGTSHCKIRNCCKSKSIEGCWECDEMDGCETLAWLDPVHERANVQNMEIIKEKGIKAFLEGEKYW